MPRPCRRYSSKSSKGRPVNCSEAISSVRNVRRFTGMARQRLGGGSPRPRGAFGFTAAQVECFFHTKFSHLSTWNFMFQWLRRSQRSPIAMSAMSKALHAVGAAVLMDRAPLGKLPCEQSRKMLHIWRLWSKPKISRLQYICSIAAQDNPYELYIYNALSLYILQHRFCLVFFLIHQFWQRHCMTDRLTAGISTLMALRCRSAIPKPRTSWVQCQVGCKTIHNSQCLIMFMYVYVCFCRVVEDFDMWREKKHEETTWDRDLDRMFFHALSG